MSWVVREAAVLCVLVAAFPAASPAETPVRGPVDPRVRIATWHEDQVYRLVGRVGFHLDLEFERGEEFVGLAGGDLDAIGWLADGNHLFLKPRSGVVQTNLTVLTTRRTYRFEYSCGVAADPGEPVYAVRFEYSSAAAQTGSIDRRLRTASGFRPRNLDYWYRGARSLKPIEASDDGVQTRLRFDPRGDLPALFARNDDGTDSLLNYSIDEGAVVVHRVARDLVVRRGRLSGTVRNAAYRGGAEPVRSGTLSPDVERHLIGGSP